jgi:hypothetical protein
VWKFVPHHNNTVLPSILHPCPNEPQKLGTKIRKKKGRSVFFVRQLSWPIPNSQWSLKFAEFPQNFGIYPREDLHENIHKMPAKNLR